MTMLSDSYVMRVLLAPARGFDTRAQRWRRHVSASLFDPYRPELHYMRGPGPKWRAKHNHHDGH
jgi:hypothetical protein